MWPEFVEYFGSRFTHEQYLFWSRIEGTLWTAADIAIAFSLIRIGNLARRYLGLRRHRFSYVLLAATVPVAVFVPFIESGSMFLQLELALQMPHFSIILYICAVDARVGLRALHAAVERNQAAFAAEPSGSTS